MSLSFISKRVFYKGGVNGGVYPVGISYRVRGGEIANFLGAKYTENNEFDKDDLHIYVKPGSLDDIKDNDYVDVLDRTKLIPLLKDRPGIKVIAMTKVHQDYMSKELKNEIVYIPHHHINWENKKRTKNKSIVGGMIGKSSPLSYPVFNEIKDRLAKIGVEFKECFTYENRQDMLDFYDQIDFQIIWYFQVPGKETVIDHFTRHPTKIVNAASFGIPTIAQKLAGHFEFDGDYLVAETYDDIVAQVEKLKDDKFYDEMSDRVIQRAKKYHISEIAKLYQALK